MFLNLGKKILFMVAAFALAEGKALAETDNNDYICKNAVGQKDGSIHRRPSKRFRRIASTKPLKANEHSPITKKTSSLSLDINLIVLVRIK